MTERDYLFRIREYLHDPDGKNWDDDELRKMLCQAAETYSKDTGIFRGRFAFLVNSNGSCQLPEDYVSFVAGWNSLGSHIEAMPVSELSRFYGNFSSVEGDAEFCYEDLDSIGEMRLCPNPYNRQSIEKYYPSSFGLIPLSNYGIPSLGKDYGIPIIVNKFQPTGTAVYIRTEEFERIPDYMALIYHVAYQAYTVDSDFQNASKGALYHSQYKRRIAHFCQMKTFVSGVKSGGKYF